MLPDSVAPMGPLHSAPNENPKNHVDRAKMKPQVLKLDVSGIPESWISLEDAAHLLASAGVAWTLGEPFAFLRGGVARSTGLQSTLVVHPIVASGGRSKAAALAQALRLGKPNAKLFRRDRMTCACCGDVHREASLTREHIIPISRVAQTAG